MRVEIIGEVGRFLEQSARRIAPRTTSVFLLDDEITSQPPTSLDLILGNMIPGPDDENMIKNPDWSVNFNKKREKMIQAIERDFEDYLDQLAERRLAKHGLTPSSVSN